MQQNALELWPFKDFAQMRTTVITDGHEHNSTIRPLKQLGRNEGLNNLVQNSAPEAKLTKPGKNRV